jgi:hypothetical protein
VKSWNRDVSPRQALFRLSAACSQAFQPLRNEKALALGQGYHQASSSPKRSHYSE